MELDSFIRFARTDGLWVRPLALASISALAVMGFASSADTPARAATSTDLIITVDTTLADSDGNTIVLWGGLANTEVKDWGDGIRNNLTRHTYSEPGVYDITIATGVGGIMWDICLNSCQTVEGKVAELIDVKQWGNTTLGGTTLTSGAFSNSTSLVNFSASGVPALLANMSGVFFGATAFNGDISNWDTSRVTRMDGLFARAGSFNQPIHGWDTSRVTNMSMMFFYASDFNQPIGTWNTSQVLQMDSMFESARRFNQSIGDWDTSRVTTMRGMFNSAWAFNQPIQTWNTSSVTDTNGMLYNAGNFDQTLGGLDMTRVTEAADMLSYSGMSPQSLDATYIGWGGQELRSGVSFSAWPAMYTDAASTARSTLTQTFGWIGKTDGLDSNVIDGGMATPPGPVTDLKAAATLSDTTIVAWTPGNPGNTVPVHREGTTSLTTYIITGTTVSGMDETVHVPGDAARLTLRGHFLRVAVTPVNSLAAGPTSTVEVTPAPLPQPNPVINLIATQEGRGKAKVSWIRPQGASSSFRYVVQAQLDDSGTWTCETVKTSCVVSDLPTGKYVVTVTANDTGTGTQSTPSAVRLTLVPVSVVVTRHWRPPGARKYLYAHITITGTTTGDHLTAWVKNREGDESQWVQAKGRMMCRPESRNMAKCKWVRSASSRVMVRFEFDGIFSSPVSYKAAAGPRKAVARTLDTQKHH